MSEKRYLRALTPAARRALGGETFVLGRFPFRVGRQDHPPHDEGASPERASGKAGRASDFGIREAGSRKFLSRDHFLIDLRPDGRFVLVDRGSALGTIVEGRLVGGHRRGGETELA
ncbi:MAG: FHA domain-containing protein, partial [Acidobacteria bacterium]|nr:FHA domain-containing protein [Acidobacteriota bacterium]